MAVYVNYDDLVEHPEHAVPIETPIKATVASPKQGMLDIIWSLQVAAGVVNILKGYTTNPPRTEVLKATLFSSSNDRISNSAFKFYDKTNVSATEWITTNSNTDDKISVFFVADKNQHSHNKKNIILLPLNEKGVNFYKKNFDLLNESPSSDQLFYKYACTYYLIGFFQLVSVLGIFYGLFRLKNGESFFTNFACKTRFHEEYTDLFEKQSSVDSNVSIEIDASSTITPP